MPKISLASFFTKQNLATIFIVFFTVYLAWLLFAMLQPYFWAFFFSLLFYIAARNSFAQLMQLLRMMKSSTNMARHLAAAITIFALLFLIIFPSVFLVRQLAGDIMTSIRHINIYLQTNTLEQSFQRILSLQDDIFWQGEVGNFIRKNLLSIFDKYSDIFQADHLQDYFAQILTYIQNAFQATFGISTSLLLAIVITYFLLTDEAKIFQTLLRNLPFSKKNLQNMLNTSYNLILNILKGNLVIALLLGGYASIGFFICGMENAILLGTLAGISTLLPIVGSSIVWVPVALYLILISNATSWAIFLLIYSLLGFIVIEVILKPKVLNTALKIHPLLIFFALMGGILKFGIIGVVLGPLILSLFVVLWRFNLTWR